MLRSLLAVLALAPLLAGQIIIDPRLPDVPDRGRHPRLLPIQVASQRVEVEIEDGVARTALRHAFHNPNGRDLEGTFLFPLPAEAALRDFALKVGGRMIPGEVLEKEKAAAIYQSIVARERDPALLEYMGRGLFQARVFPIPARGAAEVELRYEEVLRRDGQTFEYRHPLRTRAATREPVGEVVVSITLRSKVPLTAIYSPTHAVDVVKRGEREARVSFERRQDPGDSDFVLTYAVSEDAVGISLFTHGGSGEEGSFLLLIAPSDEKTRGVTVAKDVTFVIDTSGSMAGPKMEQTRRALRYCIRSLSPEDRFNLVTFATEAEVWKPALVAATPELREEAVRHVDGLVARGGTNIRDAIVSTLAMSRSKDRPFFVVFMTDGEPTVGVTAAEQILSDVRKANESLVRLFVFGVGDQLRVDLLDRLAEENQGSRDYVSPTEDIEVKVSSFFQRVSSPVMTDIRLEFEGVEVRQLHPRSLGDLFRGSQLLVVGRYRGEGTARIRLHGKVNGTPVEHRFEGGFAPRGPETAFVQRLWAVRHVGWLLDQIRLHGESRELREEVVALAKKHGIVTPYTSYLVVEDVVASTGAGLRPGTGGAEPPMPPRRRGEVQDRGAGGAVGAGSGEAGRFAETGRALRGLAGGAAPGSPSGEAEARSRPQSDAAKPGAEDENRAEATRRSDAEKERESLKAKFDRDYFRDAVETSLALRKLRDATTGEGGGAGILIRQVDGRTFYWVEGVYVEAAALALGPAEIAALPRVVAFSPEYFELLKAGPEIARILALGEAVLFRGAGGFVLVHPAHSGGK
jgi:uncharacterized protein YegL